MKNIFINLKNKSKLDEINWLLIIWLISSLLTYIWIKFFGMQLDALWDAVWGLFGTLISTVVLIFVIQSYKIQSKAFSLQEKELEKTRAVLQSQEEAMKEQRIEQMIMNLLELSKNHLNDFRKILGDKKNSTLNSQKDIITSYIERTLDTHKDIQKWILDSAIYYFRTLKYIEDQIIFEYSNNSKILKKYNWLLETQITDNLRTLHWLLLNSKEWIDKNLITFEYLFSNTEIKPEDPETKPKLGIFGSNF